MSFQTKKGEKEKEREKNGKNRGIGLILISKLLALLRAQFHHLLRLNGNRNLNTTHSIESAI